MRIRDSAGLLPGPLALFQRKSLRRAAEDEALDLIAALERNDAADKPLATSGRTGDAREGGTSTPREPIREPEPAHGSFRSNAQSGGIPEGYRLVPEGSRSWFATLAATPESRDWLGKLVEDEMSIDVFAEAESSRFSRSVDGFRFVFVEPPGRDSDRGECVFVIEAKSLREASRRRNHRGMVTSSALRSALASSLTEGMMARFDRDVLLKLRGL